MSGVSPALLATSVLLTGLAGFGAGHFLSSPTAPASYTDGRTPIVDPEAWNKYDPNSTSGLVAIAACQPAEAVTAMQTSLQNSAPRDAVARIQDASFTETLPDERADTAEVSDASYTVEPLAGDDGETGISSITVLSKAEADRAWDDQPPASTANDHADMSDAETPSS